MVRNPNPSLIPYVGGKHKQAPFLLQLVPEEQPFYLIIGFAGGLNMFFALPRKSWRSAVIIDIDNDLTTMYEVLAFQREDFFDELSFLPEASDVIFNKINEIYKNQPEWEKLPLKRRAVWFYWLLKNRYQGAFPANGMGAYQGLITPSGTRGLVQGRRPIGLALDFFVEKLQSAEIRCGNSLKLLKHRYGGRNAFWFLDPPYKRRDRRYSQKSSKTDYDFFYELFEILKYTRAKWMLTIDLVDEIPYYLEDEWFIYPLNTKYRIGMQRGQVLKESKEVVVLNYPPPDDVGCKLEDTRIPAEIFKI